MPQDMETDEKLNTSLDDLVSKSRPPRSGGREGGWPRDGHRDGPEGGRGQKRERNPDHTNGACRTRCLARSWPGALAECCFAGLFPWLRVSRGFRLARAELDACRRRALRNG